MILLDPLSPLQLILVPLWSMTKFFLSSVQQRLLARETRGKAEPAGSPCYRNSRSSPGRSCTRDLVIRSNRQKYFLRYIGERGSSKRRSRARHKTITNFYTMLL